MKKVLSILFLVILSFYSFSQNVGVGTLNPTHTLHVVVDASNPNQDPVLIEGLQNTNAADTVFLVTDPTQGIVQYLTKADLINSLGGVNTDQQNIDSVTLTGSILTVYIENGNSANVDLSSLISTDDQNIDSLTLTTTILTTYIEDGSSANIDLINLASDSSFYTTIKDSLLNDTLWLSELKDSLDSDIDSVILRGDTAISLFEDGNEVIADISDLIDSSEWIDGSRVGLTSGAIYARKALQRGDTVVVDTNGNMGIGAIAPSEKVHVFRETGDVRLKLESDPGNTNEDWNPAITMSQDGNGMEAYIGLIHDIAQSNGIALNNPVIGMSTGNPLLILNNDNRTRSEAINFGIKDTIAMVISNRRYVGIGVEDPNAPLHILTDQSNPIDIQNSNSHYNDPSNISLIRILDSNATPYGYIGDGSAAKHLSLIGHFDYGVSLASFASNTNASNAAGILVNAHFMPHQRKAVVFSTKGAQRAIIDSNGNVGIGLIVPTQRLHVAGNILASGTITSSDRKYKTNIEPVNNGIELLNQINPVTYYFKDKYTETGQFDKKLHIGVIAQELEEVLPNMVYTDNNGFKAVNYTEFTPLLIKAVQEQQSVINKLEEENKSLKIQESKNAEDIEELKNQVEELKRIIQNQLNN